MNMDGAPESVVVLRAWLVFVLTIGILGNSKLAAPNTEHAATKLAANIPENNYQRNAGKLANNNPGFISIDCGVMEDYYDERIGIFFKLDTSFVDTGISHQLPSTYISQNPYYGRQINNLRSFPQGTKNCYNLKLEQGKNNSYLIRAIFNYGNYDNQNQFPTFDVYIGVNLWMTLQIENAYEVHFLEIIHVPSFDTIFVCLVNTGNGVPFISTLELRHLGNSSYRIDSGGLQLFRRYDMGASNEKFARYKDDVYDRLWETRNYSNYISINTSSDIDVQDSKDGYELPPQVLRTAVVLPSGYSDKYFSFDLVGGEYYVYLHFAEIQKHAQSQKREFNIYWNGEEYLKEPITLDYLKPLSISLPNTSATGEFYLNLNATQGSELPPILNALEIFKVVPFPLLPTDLKDVFVVTNIKSMYHVNKSWQGDPCAPRAYLWDGLDCAYPSSDPPRIISLNLSSSRLMGEIAPSISNLKMKQTLDLSYNNLTGPIPDSLAQLPYLTTLYLKGNKLTGSVPDALAKKWKDGKLKLSVEENPVICQSFPCKKKKKTEFVIPVVASFVAVLILLFVFSALAIYKRKRHGGNKEMKQKMLIQELGGHLIKKGKVENDGQTSHDVQFLSFESITAATNNFSTENKLGKGGFGPVYKGKLSDGKEIAIKRLPRNSGQGLVEFKNEALLIVKLQHANLVRLLGFCVQEEEKLLIYEYMSNKSLDFFLFDSTKKKVLTWKIRFNIIESIAQGLVFLHKYSRPRVIHRDLKASNILLDDEMNPKISDFGMAKILGLKASEEQTNRVVGTYGYMSPEYAINGVVSIKTDVFSFGVLLLEIVSGKKNNSHYHSSYPINLIGYAWQLWNEDRGIELIDPTLDESCLPNEALRCIHIGLLCVQDHAADRPTMVDVASMLSNETTQLTPPKQPAFFYQYSRGSAKGI